MRFWCVCADIRQKQKANIHPVPCRLCPDWKSGMSVPTDIAIAYLIQGSFYGHSIYATIYMDAWRKDSAVMVVHHIITLALICFSYAFRYLNLLRPSVCAPEANHLPSWLYICSCTQRGSILSFLKAVAVMHAPRLSSVRLQSRRRAILDDYYGFKIGEVISRWIMIKVGGLGLTRQRSRCVVLSG